MGSNNCKLAMLMVVAGMMGGIWALARTTPYEPYQQLVDAVAARAPFKTPPVECAALGPLSPEMRKALHCPGLSSGR